MAINNIGFFTPIHYLGKKTALQKLEEGIDDYFYLGGRVAYVIPAKQEGGGERILVRKYNQGKISQLFLGALKVISYLTGVIPLFMLIAKAGFRADHKFHTKPKIASNDHPIPLKQKTEAAAKTSLGAPKTSGENDLEKEPTLVKTAEGKAVVQTPLSPQTTDGSSVASLMDKFTKSWNSGTKKFDFQGEVFKLYEFRERLSRHAEKFSKKDISNETHFGYIEKFDLDPKDNPQIYMRADLHGDLKSLIENLRSLQEQGLLDANFKCKPGIHLVFLGDYCDRGNYGTQILELLMSLREENPDQVHLIRGNHEYNIINMQFGFTDFRLQLTVQDKEASEALERFYETMSLTTYFGLNEGEHREYVQCTHGTFEPTMDPAPLLDHAASGSHLPVPKERSLSERICKIAEGSSELAASAKRIQQIVNDSKYLEEDITAYNWGDVSEKSTSLCSLGERTYALNAKDIKHYLDLSSEQHKVMMLFRGHQHKFQHLMHEGKVLATTLPVGMDCPGYQNNFVQPDRAYIIKPKAHVEDWTKAGILREKGHAATDEITDEHPLTSSAI